MIPHGTPGNNPEITKVGGIPGQFRVGEPAFAAGVLREGPRAQAGLYDRRVISTIGVLPYRFFTGTGKIEALLPPRTQPPTVSAWVIGAEERTSGVTLEEAAQDLLFGELVIASADPALMFLVGDYEIQWDTRPVGEGGYHERMAVVAFGMAADQEFTVGDEPDPGSLWIDTKAVIDAEPGTYHTTLVEIITQLELQLHKLPQP